MSIIMTILLQQLRRREYLQNSYHVPGTTVFENMIALFLQVAWDVLPSLLFIIFLCQVLQLEVHSSDAHAPLPV